MFSWKTLEEMREAAEKAGAQLPLAEDTSCLRQSWQAGTHAVPNRIVIQPMEGCDSEADVHVVWVYISYLRKKLASLQANVQIRVARNAGYSLEEIP